MHTATTRRDLCLARLLPGGLALFVVAFASSAFAQPPAPSEAQLDARLVVRPYGGTPRGFFGEREETTVEFGINAVAGTAQLYRVVVFLEGFALELPAPFQPVGRLDVQIGAAVAAFPLLALNADRVFADMNGNGHADDWEPTILFRGASMMVVTIPFGGDLDPHSHEVPFDGRVTVTGTFLKPVTPGMHLVRAMFTSVDPDTGGRDDGSGIPPHTLVIDRTVEIRPNHPPVCAAAQPSVGVPWPANHKLVTVKIVGVTDPDGDPLALTVTQVTQDEPVDGVGDGDTSPDAVIQGATVALRAERSGKGNGRVYWVRFGADDGRGGICAGAVAVCVPHDKGNNSATCIDDGQRYSSTERPTMQDDSSGGDHDLSELRRGSGLLRCRSRSSLDRTACPAAGRCNSPRTGR